MAICPFAMVSTPINSSPKLTAASVFVRIEIIIDYVQCGDDDDTKQNSDFFPHLFVLLFWSCVKERVEKSENEGNMKRASVLLFCIILYLRVWCEDVNI